MRFLRLSPCLSPLSPLFCLGCLALASFPALRAAETEPVDELKQTTDRWLRVEQQIADEQNQWRTEKEVLQTSVRVLQQEKTALEEKMAANELATGLFQTRLEKAQADLAEHEGAHRLVLARCEALGQRLRTLEPRLPEPLRQKIAPMMEKLARGGSDTPSSVADRAQAVSSILAAVDQFNNSLTLTHQLRPGAAGETLDVKVLYWGLAMACAIDGSGQRGWLLTPGANGWTWRDAPEYVPAIAELVAIYEKQGSPEMVLLPVLAKGGQQ